MAWIDLAKLAIVPAIVVVVTLFARRAGPAAAGFLAGLPLVAGPILALLVAAHGNRFGATSALASAIGVVPTMLFAVAFARFAPHLRPLPCLLAAYGAYFAAVSLTTLVPLDWRTALLLPCAAWWLTLRAFPVPAGALPPRSVPRWDLPMRVLATFTLVAAVTYLAKSIGARFAGLLTPFPIITAVLAMFSHTQSGASTAAILLRSLVRGLLSFIVFFVMLGVLLPSTSAVLAFGASLAGCLACHAMIARYAIGAPTLGVGAAELSPQRS